MYIPHFIPPLFLSCISLTAAPIISEFMASNDSTLNDEDGDSSDWIEIHNPDATSVNLAGYRLTNSAVNPTLWTFPSTTLAAGEYLVVFASNKNRAVSGSEHHSNFKISAGGGYLALADSSGTILSSFNFPAQSKDVSYGQSQQLNENQLTGTAVPQILVPSSSGDLASNWNSLAFTPGASWTTGTAPASIGYDTSGNPSSGGTGGTPQNLAPAGTATQSSTLDQYTASLAIDGNFGNFTHTLNTDSNPNWTLDLGTRSLLSEITLNNRSGSSAQRLRDITVQVFDDDGVTETFNSGVLNPNNVDSSPGLINLDLIAATGSEVIGKFIKVTRTPDPTSSGNDAVVISLKEVEVLGIPSLGFTSLINNDIEADAQNANASAFVRLPFNVADASVLASLELKMRYDAGFVAYLNGTEVARRNAPTTPVWNSSATTERDNFDVLDFESIDLNSNLNLLTNSTNLLAIHMLNSSTNDEDFLVTPRLIAGQTNTSGSGFLVTPTPGATNNSEWYLDKVADTSFDMDRGYYDAPFSLNITTLTPGATIRYTTDGTPPSENNGNVYSGPITISETTVIRAMAYRNAYRSTDIDTHTYLFRDDIIASSVMDTAITQNATYGPQMRDALTDLPAISLSFTGGIDRTEKEVAVELIGFENGDLQVDAGMERYGNYVTNFDKRNIRLNFRSRYGPKNLNYPLFQGHDHNLSPVNQFDSLDLRTGSHDMVARGFYMSNRFLDDTHLDMGHLNPHGRFIHTYVNGTYQGMYHLRERWNADMHANYLGGNEENYEAVASNRGGGSFSNATTYDGDGSAWANVIALGGDYENLKNYLNVPQLIDFMLLLSSGNCEAEHRAVSPVGTGSGYTFYHNDGDGFTRSPNFRTTHNGPNNLWASLRAEAHPDFMVLLADRLEKHYKNGGAMTPEKALPRLAERTTQIERAFFAESARWGYRTPANWASARDSYINNHLSGLSNTVYNRFQSDGLLPSAAAPQFSQHGGAVNSGSLLNISSTTGGTVYYTTDGSDPRLPGGAISPTAIPFSPSGGTTQNVISFGATWNYLDNGSNQSTAWREQSFNDASWSTGAGELGYNQSGTDTTISFGNDEDNKHITTYFRKAFTLTNVSEITAAEIRIIRDDGAVVYLNGTELERINLPSSPTVITYLTEADNAISSANEPVPVTFTFSPSELINGTNTIAVEMHQAAPTSSDLSFDLELNVTRPITGGDELTITDNSHIRARTKGSDWSGLTEAFFTVNGIASLLPTDITISEIHYNPDGGSENAEFLELLNTGTRPVNLRSNRFLNGITFDFPTNRDTIIHPGKRLIIVGSLYDMNILHGLGLPIAGIHKGNFKNSGEQITLIDGNATVLSDLTFTDLSPWPTAPDGGGPSLTLIGNGLVSNPDSWRSSLVVGGTPGGNDETLFAGDPLADDDGNGLSNLLDHALGNTLTPTEALPVITNVSYNDGSGLKDYLGVSYRANLTDPNLTFIIEVSADLVNWTDGPAAAQLAEHVDQGDGTANIVMRSGTSVSDLPQQFMRLKVTHTR
ncbi:lamin tail domain-containing protein [Akkermansiaceae bacterium]|nr:lamin tail domain-containing protein [Akkermansiaceae bacterium]